MWDNGERKPQCRRWHSHRPPGGAATSWATNPPHFYFNGVNYIYQNKRMKIHYCLDYSFLSFLELKKYHLSYQITQITKIVNLFQEQNDKIVTIVTNIIHRFFSFWKKLAHIEPCLKYCHGLCQGEIIWIFHLRCQWAKVSLWWKEIWFLI